MPLADCLLDRIILFRSNCCWRTESLIGYTEGLLGQYSSETLVGGLILFQRVYTNQR
uniref:Uncharacterized protein n=1 Tax=Anguilla anguilla TaxID=7936 RepID=A0A0E9VD37_ANGAN